MPFYRVCDLCLYDDIMRLRKINMKGAQYNIVRKCVHKLLLIITVILNEFINASFSTYTMYVRTNITNASHGRNNTWEMRLYGLAVKSCHVLAPSMHRVQFIELIT
jgi:hypothetical protein